MTTNHMKSNEIRQQWREVLADVQAGGTIVVEHYNRPIARITPMEPDMSAADTIETATESLAGIAEHIRVNGIDTETYGAVGDLLERVTSIVSVTVNEVSARSETAGHALANVREYLATIVTSMDMAAQPVSNALTE